MNYQNKEKEIKPSTGITNFLIKNSYGFIKSREEANLLMLILTLICFMFISRNIFFPKNDVSNLERYIFDPSKVVSEEEMYGKK